MPSSSTSSSSCLSNNMIPSSTLILANLLNITLLLLLLLLQGQLLDAVPPYQEIETNDGMVMTSLNGHLKIACTNRHNCEQTCARLRAAKDVSKRTLRDQMAQAMGGEHSLTDAHRLGLQFGQKRTCDRCAMVYSNCGDAWYRMARRQLFAAAAIATSSRRSDEATGGDEPAPVAHVFAGQLPGSKANSNRL